MSAIYLISDTHLAHKNIVKYRGLNITNEQHDQMIIDNIANTVTKRDTLIGCGDIAFSAEALQRYADIKCLKKILVLGNHDTERGLTIKDLALVFDEIHSMYKTKRATITHFPVHPNQLRGRINIHGHSHDWCVVDNDGRIDERYINVSCEYTNYAPITLQYAMSPKYMEHIKARYKGVRLNEKIK